MAVPEPTTEDSDDAIRSWAKLPRRDMRTMQSGPADGDFKLELMKHLSKEVEMAQHQLIAQRSKNNLLVAFGPYLALTLLLANPDLRTAFYRVSGPALAVFSFVFVIGFGLIGALAAQIEAKFWDQANEWRKEISLLAGWHGAKLEFSSSRLTIVYVAIYVGSSAVLMGMLWAAHLLK